MTISKEHDVSKKIWTTADYASDSAVFFLDAKENAGAGKPFDINATTWCDLAPNPSNQAVGDKTYYGFNDDWSFVANRTSADKRWKTYAALKGDAIRAIDSENFTIEFYGYHVTAEGLSYSTNSQPLMFSGNSIADGTVNYGWMSLGDNFSDRWTSFNYNGKAFYIGSQVAEQQKCYLALVVNGKEVKAYVDGKLVKEAQIQKAYNQTNWYVGNNTYVHRIAIHSRALLPEEIALNYAVDKKRFTL